MKRSVNAVLGGRKETTGVDLGKHDYEKIMSGGMSLPNMYAGHMVPIVR